MTEASDRLKDDRESQRDRKSVQKTYVPFQVPDYVIPDVLLQSRGLGDGCDWRQGTSFQSCTGRGVTVHFGGGVERE